MNCLGLFTTMFIYVTVGVICVFMFGEAIRPSVLYNIGEEREVQGKTYWEAYVLQVSFCIVLICHIPFIFFSGKEGMLIMIDEVKRKSISNALWHKLQANSHFRNSSAAENPPNEELPIPGETEPYIEALRKSR